MKKKDVCVICKNSYPVEEMEVIPRGMVDPEPDCGEPDPFICRNCLDAAGTTGVCARCGLSLPTEDLKLIPETEQYIRQAALSHCSGAPIPAQLDEEEIREKYGIPHDAMLCPGCFELTLSKAAVL